MADAPIPSADSTPRVEKPECYSAFVGFDSFGDFSVLQVRHRPAPLPRAGEVRVRVTAATVNPTDLLMRSGQHAGAMTHLEPPFIAGMEFSGRVDRRGEDVDESYLGQRVIGVVNPRRPRGGSHSEHVCISTASVAVVDESVDFVHAATVPMNGLTARAAVRSLGANSKGTVLVTGGAGAVGSFAIQMLARTEATVIADAKPEDRGAIASFGADYVMSRGNRLQEQIRRQFPDGIDGIIDGALIGRSLVPILKSGATLVELRRNDGPLAATGINHEVISIPNHFTDAAGLMELAADFADGCLETRVAAEFSPEMAGDAHRLLEAGGVRGRILLRF